VKVFRYGLSHRNASSGEVPQRCRPGRNWGRLVKDSHSAAAIVGHEFQYTFPWISGVDRISYDATVPFARLDFYSEKIPLDIQLEA
jgi:hypothetical protein